MPEKKTWGRETTGLMLVWGLGLVTWLVWSGSPEGIGLMNIVLPSIFMAYSAAFLSKRWEQVQSQVSEVAELDPDEPGQPKNPGFEE